ncbi:hypothetical protein BDW68DRAFT_183729 [Aspergillus falconensis]
MEYKSCPSDCFVFWKERASAAQSALPQPIIYLAAVQDSRKESNKINSSVFELITDSGEYQFAWLDEYRDLLVSEAYLWVTKKIKIIQRIDRILQDAIEASPHTTPAKTENTAIHAGRSRGHTAYRVIKKGPYGKLVTELEMDEE